MPAIRFIQIKNTWLRFIVSRSKDCHPPDQHQYSEEQDEHPVNSLVHSALSFVAHGCISVFNIRSSIYFLCAEIVSFKYFSTIKLAIGAANCAPNPAFSITTAIAIFGL